MNYTRMLTSLVGSYAGSMLGGRLGGTPGSLIGSLAGSVLGASGVGGTTNIVHDLEAKAQSMMTNHTEPDQSASATQQPTPGGSEVAGMSDADAEVLITMMVNAAKADGHIDQTETDAIVARLGDLDEEEKRYLTGALNAPFVEAATLGATTPPNLAEHAYAVSVMAVSTNELSEKRYLLELAQALHLTDAKVDEVNRELGATI